MGGVATKDKRLLLVAALYSIILFVNVSYLSSVLGYSANGYEVIENTTLLSVFGSLSLLAVFIHFFAVYDIVVARQSYELVPMHSTYIARVKKVFRVIGAKWQLMINGIRNIFKKG